MRSRLKRTPRVAYCNGCNITFFKTHTLINHRNTERCGGRFLTVEQREIVDYLRQDREERLREIVQHLK